MESSFFPLHLGAKNCTAVYAWKVSLCSRLLSYLKWDGCHSGVTYETFTGNLWGFFLFLYLLRVTQPSWSIVVWQLIKSFQTAHISWFAFLLSAEDVASERGHSVRLQSVPGVGSRLTGLAAGDPRYLLRRPQVFSAVHQAEERTTSHVQMGLGVVNSFVAV